MDLLGPNLHDLLDSNIGMFDVEVVSVLGLKMIKGIRDIHEKGLIHRDIKPINFCIEHGCKDPTSAGIFIIDFGLSRLYRDSNGDHIGFKTGKKGAGTAKYWSIWTHEGIE